MDRRSIAADVASKRCAAEDVLRFIEPGMDVVVGAANGEPVGVLDAIEGASESLEKVRLHQMIPLGSRPYIEGGRPGLRHVSWFLSPHDRAAFSSRRLRPGSQFLQRRATADAPDAAAAARGRCRLRSGSPWLLLARNRCRICGGTDRDHRIAELVAERILDGATLQAGIGAVPNLVLQMLGGHRELGVHTELLSDGFVDLVEARRRDRHP